MPISVIRSKSARLPMVPPVVLTRYRPLDPDRTQTVSGDSDMGTDHLQWESVKERVIKAGSVEKLVECLIGADDLMDSRHFNVFFATYRAFTEPPVVLDRLLRRYESLENEVNCSTSALVVQNSVRSILICWLDMYPEDYYDPESDFAMLTNLLDFGQRHKLVDLRGKAKKLREKFKRIAEEGGMIASVPSLDQLAYAFGYDVNEYSQNPRDRVKMFDVGKENCVQIAEQLTFWDAALFKELLIHQCQGHVWSRREKLSRDRVYTVKATIDQFNAVSLRVMTSIVLPDCRPDFRAKIIAKWIDIARELRALKNFSSLKAVLSSLQAECVHRLKSVWSLLSNRSITQYKELSSIYEIDAEGDEHNARKILDQEGTAKSSPLRRPQLIQNCRRTKSDVNLAECQGTVPYLGSFLHDLTMIDEANPNFTDDTLINFDKRRKEFEVLAKLRLFQSAARAYKIPMDRVFCAWFAHLPCLTEKECFQRSLEIEKPASMSTPDMHSRTHSNGNGSSTQKSTLSRLFNTSRNSDELSSNNNTPLHSHSHSSSSQHHQHLNGCGINGTPPLLVQRSSDSGFQCEDWIDGRVDGGPPGPVPLCDGDSLPRNAKPPQSMTAPSTPQGTISWKGGRSTFYHGCEFSPGHIFPGAASTTATPPTNGSPHPIHTRNLSDDSTQELRTSLSRTSIEFAAGSRSVSRSGTPQMNRFVDQMENGGQYGSRGSMRGHQTRDSDGSSCSSTSSGHHPSGLPPLPTSFHLARVGLDDDLKQNESGTNYKCIKIENGDRMPELIARALEKHMITAEDAAGAYCLVQLLPNGGEFLLPEKCNPYYAMAPDPSSPILNLILRKRGESAENGVSSPHIGPNAKKINKMKRSNLLRWSSGYL